LKVKEYNTEEFRAQFTTQHEHLSTLFKLKYYLFFCIRIEDLLPYANLPIPPAKENSHSAIFITQGVFELEKGNEKYCVHPNESIIIPAGEVFSVQQLPDNLRGFSLHFSPELLADRGTHALNHFDFLLPYSNSYFQNAENTPEIIYLFNRLEAIYQASGFQKSRLIKSYLYSLLCEYQTCQDASSAQSNKHLPSITYEFKKLLYQRFREQHRTTYYADQLGITPNHLNKVLKTTTQKSTISWINEMIILEAKFLLHRSVFNISEIAMQVGIADASYFTRLFKKNVGLSPSSYKKMIE